jgi:hypothetical protein
METISTTGIRNPLFLWLGHAQPRDEQEKSKVKNPTRKPDVLGTPVSY